MASVLNSESTGSITCMLCYQTRHLTPTVPLPTQVYNQVTANLMRGGNPAMDQHPNQRGVYLDILLVTSCYRNRDKFQPDRPLSLYADFAYLILNTIVFILFLFSQRALHPPEVKHERLFVVSVLGFFVNLIGIFVFHHGSAAGILYMKSLNHPWSSLQTNIASNN